MGSRTVLPALGWTGLVLLGCFMTPNARGAQPADAPQYSTCKTWKEVLEGESFRYAPISRVSDPGTKGRPVYSGFWFFDGWQFDESGRYALGMKVHLQERDVTASDRGRVTADARVALPVELLLQGGTSCLRTPYWHHRVVKRETLSRLPLS